LSDYQKVIIRFELKTTYHSESMELDLSSIKRYTEVINVSMNDILESKRNIAEPDKSKKFTSNEKNHIFLQAPLQTWTELYLKDILRFIDDSVYTPHFARRILQDKYKTLTLLIENMKQDLIKNKMIHYYEDKLSSYKGKFLNSINQKHQNLFW